MLSATGENITLPDGTSVFLSNAPLEQNTLPVVPSSLTASDISFTSSNAGFLRGSFVGFVRGSTFLSSMKGHLMTIHGGSIFGFDNSSISGLVAAASSSLVVSNYEMFIQFSTARN